MSTSKTHGQSNKITDCWITQQTFLVLMNAFFQLTPLLFLKRNLTNNTNAYTCIYKQQHTFIMNRLSDFKKTKVCVSHLWIENNQYSWEWKKLIELNGDLKRKTSPFKFLHVFNPIKCAPNHDFYFKPPPIFYMYVYQLQQTAHNFFIFVNQWLILPFH